eukprot:TRINITY_DN4266_c1_g4_i1.p1 TRINITY_DN4266_c1_g4~~TRINITY_DN4266_c1_g4_i1.p1  ORF type:complete len:287 (-),score=10.79 TRINITY_DN4266_c1_g4_i1:307-1167(-)
MILLQVLRSRMILFVTSFIAEVRSACVVAASGVVPIGAGTAATSASTVASGTSFGSSITSSLTSLSYVSTLIWGSAPTVIPPPLGMVITVTTEGAVAASATTGASTLTSAASLPALVPQAVNPLFHIANPIGMMISTGAESVAAGSVVSGASTLTGAAATAGGVAALSAPSWGTGAGVYASSLSAASSRRRKMAVGIAAVLGSVVVGADAGASSVTWDCWKPILRERSAAPSRGRLLIDILDDPVIDEFYVGSQSVFVRNRWNESWRIDPVVLPWGQLAAHASQIM